MRTGIILLAATLAAAAQTNKLTPEEKKDGFVLLFDGRTMNGWEDPRTKTPAGDAWTIEDGCLHTKKNARITEDLFSKQKYRDFELRFEWRISPAGNSGVKYRIQDHLYLYPTERGERFEKSVERSFEKPITTRPEHGQDYVVGFEYQITDDSSNRDAKSNPKHTAGALYDIVAPSQAASKPVGQFNESRIVVRGTHVEHWLNGVKVVDSSLDSPAAMEGINKRWAVAPHVLELMSKQPAKECPISLQNHGDNAWFRSIRIKNL